MYFGLMSSHQTPSTILPEISWTWIIATGLGAITGRQGGDPTLPGWGLEIVYYDGIDMHEQLQVDTGRIYFSFDDGTQGELYCDLGGYVLKHHKDTLTVDCRWSNN